MIKLTIAFALLLTVTRISAQVNRTEIKRIYEEAEKMYQSGNYNASLAYLKNEAGTSANTSDSLLYLRILNLDKIYRTNFQLTTDLEAAFKSFFARANRVSFPEIKYGEVSAIYTQFLGFKEKDKLFYDSVVNKFDINNHPQLVPTKNTLLNYLAANPNTYYSKEHNATITQIDNKLAELASIRQKQKTDSIYKERIKAVGKKISVNFGYAVPNAASGNFKPFINKTDVINFFNGSGNPPLNEKYSINLSVAEAFINLSTGKRFKIGIDWIIFDGELTQFDWSSDTLLTTSETGGNQISKVTLLKAGTRIGLLAAGMISKRMAIGVYYSARPGIQFFTKPFYFRSTNGSGSERFEITHEISNFNLTNEIGLKLYFFERTFSSVFYDFGDQTWKSVFNNLSNPSSGSTKTKAEYPFKSIGFRIGF